MHPVLPAHRPVRASGLQLNEVDALATAFLAQQRGRGDHAHSDQHGADDEPARKAALSARPGGS
jgi:hypothetical protein